MECLVLNHKICDHLCVYLWANQIPLVSESLLSNGHGRGG